MHYKLPIARSVSGNSDNSDGGGGGGGGGGSLSMHSMRLCVLTHCPML